VANGVCKAEKSQDVPAKVATYGGAGSGSGSGSGSGVGSVSVSLISFRDCELYLSDFRIELFDLFHVLGDAHVL
jgi:hypothetical protein